jgi:hypothetical protein
MGWVGPGHDVKAGPYQTNDASNMRGDRTAPYAVWLERRWSILTGRLRLPIRREQPNEALPVA